ncbi:MAG: haloacid dehalogenase-like hydrolase [Verrucomicrobia bacterium]|nr:haloacid dehalogenase-like hydrolase [Verrucomicrobiota bacterium]
MHTLLLWDIDATLIVSGGAGERALVTALQRHAGLTGNLEGVELAGRTDPLIARHFLAKYGQPSTPADVARFLTHYLAALPGELPHPQARVLPGVRELLADLATRPGIAQGLLTGNSRRGAELKLTHHGLWHHFPFGAFSDDSETRNDLGPHALRRAQAHHGVPFAPDRVYVIGDTPHDIACGQAIGARTIGVATGHFTTANLAAHGATHVFADFSDAKAFLRAIQ